MDEKRSKSSRAKKKSTFFREWGFFIAVVLLFAGLSLWSERHWATAWLSYLPPIVWTAPIVLSWLWPLVLRKKISWPSMGAQIVFLTLILGFRLPLFAAFRREEPSLKVGSFNIERGTAEPSGIAKWAVQENLDVICFQEANVRDEDFWRELKAEMPGWTLLPRREVAVMTRMPVKSSTAVQAPALDREVQIVEIAQPPLTIINSHWPALPMRLSRSKVPDFEYWMEEREACCRQLEKIVKGTKGAAVICGDFNTPLNTGIFDRIQGLGRHAHRSAGWGFAWSYPAKFPVTAIDHIVVRNGEPLSFKVGPNLGSDHRPVSAAIHLRA